MSELKSSTAAVLERPPADSAPAPDWKAESDRILRESEAIEEYSKEHGCTSQEAAVALAARKNAETLLPGAVSKLAMREGKAAREIELCEAERQVLADAVSKWNSMGEERRNVQTRITRIQELGARLGAVLSGLAGQEAEFAVRADWNTEMACGQFANLLGAAQGKTLCGEGIKRQQANLEKLEAEMRAFGKTHGLAVELLP